jgi:hypothetical protein
MSPQSTQYRTNIALLCSQVWAIFSSLSLTPLTFVLFILFRRFASLVPGVADMPEAVSSPAAAIDLHIKLCYKCLFLLENTLSS